MAYWHVQVREEACRLVVVVVVVVMMVNHLEAHWHLIKHVHSVHACVSDHSFTRN